MVAVTDCASSANESSTFTVDMTRTRTGETELGGSFHYAS
jgi:hypothetical protein